MLLRKITLSVLLFSCLSARAVGPTLIQHNEFITPAFVTSGSGAYLSNVTAGDLLIADIGGWNNGATNSLTDTQGNTWSEVALLSQQTGAACGGNSAANFFWVTIAGTTGADTVSWSSLGQGTSIVSIQEWSGVGEVSYMSWMCTSPDITSFSFTNIYHPLTSQSGVFLLGSWVGNASQTVSWSGATIFYQHAPNANNATIVFGYQSIAQVTTLRGYTTSITFATPSHGGGSGLFLGAPGTGGGPLYTTPNWGSAR